MLQESACAEIAYKKRDMQLRLEKKSSHLLTLHIYIYIYIYIYDCEDDRNQTVNPHVKQNFFKNLYCHVAKLFSHSSLGQNGPLALIFEIFSNRALFRK